MQGLQHGLKFYEQGHWQISPGGGRWGTEFDVRWWAKNADRESPLQKVQLPQDFLGTLDVLQSSDKAWMAPQGAPLHGVGHSNGALMHLLISSLARTENASNVIISYNNKLAFLRSCNASSALTCFFAEAALLNT